MRIMEDELFVAFVTVKIKLYSCFDPMFFLTSDREYDETSTTIMFY